MKMNNHKSNDHCLEKNAIILGGITNHIPLIQKLKNRGYTAILIDYLDNPPAKEYADEHIQVSTFDFDEIEKIAVERNAEIIINCCLEHLNTGICKIAENIGIHAPYSYETALSISNKEIMKAKMLEGDIPTSKYYCIESAAELEEVDLHYPVFVKSAEGSGSNAVIHVFEKENAKPAVNTVLKRYPNKKVIIEEEAKGEEYNVYCFPCNGEANILMIARRYSDNDSEDHVTKCVGILSPAVISEIAINSINAIANNIVREFRLNNVPMFMQIMIDGDDVSVIEFAGRMAGGFSNLAINDTTGVDLYDATINSFLGLQNNIEFTSTNYYITVSSIYAKECIFDKVIGYKKLLNEKVIEDINIPRQSGTKISESSSNGSKAAFIVVKGETLDELMKRLDRAFTELDVLDIKGQSKIKRNIRITREMVGLREMGE